MIPLLQSSEVGGEMLRAVMMPWLLFVCAWVFFVLLGKKLGWSRQQTGALILTAGLGNTSFVGLPLLEALLGASALGIGILVDQPGTFLVLSTLGLWVAGSMSGSTAPGLRTTLKRVLTFPPFVALLGAVVWSRFPTAPQALPLQIFGRLGSTLVPLALVAVGLQLDLSPAALRPRLSLLVIGLLFKLGLMPLLFWLFWGSKGLMNQVIVLEAAMAPMITAAVVANEQKLDGELANLMLGIGIPLSLITVPLWHHFFVA